MADNQPIQSPTNDELEELTLLRIRVIQRARFRILILEEAQQILDCHQFIWTINQYLLSPAYRKSVQHVLEHRWAVLLGLIQELRLGEALDMEMLRMWEE